MPQFEDWEDAKKTGPNGSEPVEVYVSDAKAVLMSDTRKDYDNPETEPEPSVRKDPCEDTMDLAVEKIWDDLNNRDTIRPSSITIRIYRTGYDENGNVVVQRTLFSDVPDTEQNGSIIMSDSVDMTDDNNRWKRVFYGMPAAETIQDPVTGDDIMVYYSYEVEEEPVEGYTTTVTYDNETTAIITNKHRAVLPLTGGAGDIIFTAVGTASLVFIYISNSFKKKKRNRKEEDNM